MSYVRSYGQCSGTVFDAGSLRGRPCIDDATHKVADGDVLCSKCHRNYVKAKNWAAQGHKVKKYKERRKKR